MSKPSLPIADLASQEKRALLAQLLQNKARPYQLMFPLPCGQRMWQHTRRQAPENSTRVKR